MLRRLWDLAFRRAVKRDADRLMKAHGEGAYGMACIGARAARECDGRGHWSSVAREIGRRTGKVTGLAPPSAGDADNPRP